MEAKHWDVVVIGAGPAGSMAARCTALSGLQTLLVESKQFPRDKVCGGFLNLRASRLLAQCGLQSTTEVSGKSRALMLRLICNGQQVTLPLPSGQIVCRREFDTALFDSARSAGVTAMLQASATVLSTCHERFRYISISQEGETKTIAARVVICADGLGRRSVKHLPEFATTTSSESRVGVGAIAIGEENAISPGELVMVISPRGYVGISRFGKNHFNIAAAIDRSLLSQSPVVDVVRNILEQSKVSLPIDLNLATWRGTIPLTCRPRNVAAERVFLIGDAGGYVEPFTGEGMASALETGFAVGPFAAVAVSKWSQFLCESWTSLYRELVYERQSVCRQLSWVLRRPWASRTALCVCKVCPSVARYAIARTSF
jgi:flavin-dependent dehydrogenase